MSPFFQDRVVGVVLQASDKENALLRPGGIYPVVIVPPIHGDDGARGQRDLSGNRDLVFFTVGNVGIDWKVSVMVQKQMQFDRSFGPAKLRPGKRLKQRAMVVASRESSLF